jgi:diaminopimelate epimerase
MKMRFTKMHGTGNDYVYVNCMDQGIATSGENFPVHQPPPF